MARRETDPRVNVPSRIFGIALPMPHYMAFAPLDCWARLLLSRGARVPLLYLGRLAFNLYVSMLSTILTLPERILLWPFLALKGRRAQWKLRMPAIIVLGYYRSGTTHLHYLLSCDKRNQTPRWFQSLVPQGGPLAWTFARLFMIPFMSEKRPMDDVAYGPEWPAEDDFANNLWTATSVQVGRMIFTNQDSFEDSQKYMTLTDLPRERYWLWRKTLWKFLYKVTFFTRTSRLLLKSPCHTGHVNELLDFFDHGDVKFIYVNREPGATVRSNIAMSHRFEPFQLEPPAADADLKKRVVGDYRIATENYIKHRDSIPVGNLAEIRFEDMHADPIGELERAYRKLNLEFTDQFRESLIVYMNRVRDYKPATKETKEAGEALPPELAFITGEFGHDKPRIPKAEIPSPPPPRQVDLTIRILRLAAVIAVIPVICGVIWAYWSKSTHLRQEWLVWPTGTLIGWSILWAMRKGNARLGALAVAASALVWIVVCFINTHTVSYTPNPHPELAVSLTDELIPETLRQLIKPRMMFWGAVGLITAYRFASRQRVHPLGDQIR